MGDRTMTDHWRLLLLTLPLWVATGLPAQELVLSPEALQHLAAAAQPGTHSPLHGVTPGDAALAPGEATLHRTLGDPDEVWLILIEGIQTRQLEVALRDGAAWVISLADDGFHVRGPLETAEPTELVAGVLAGEAGLVLHDAAGELTPELFGVLRALAAVEERPAPITMIAAALEGRVEAAAARCPGWLETLAEAGWVSPGRSRPEPLWEVLRVEALACLDQTRERVQVTRRTREGVSASSVLLYRGDEGAIAFAGDAPGLLCGQPAGTVPQVLQLLVEAPVIPGGGAVSAGGRAGDRILEELREGIFRLGQATSTREGFGLGQVDTWRVEGLVEYQATTPSGEIDWVRVDDQGEGRWSRSFILQEGEWRESNILDVFLEIEFKLPWNRTAYRPHDVQVLLNGQEIARLEEVIPRGYHRFQVRPQDVHLAEGASARNEVRLVTTHLRGGHYVVSTDFNLIFQLATVARYVVASSAEDAVRVLRESGHFTSGGIDAALYANEWGPEEARPAEGKPVMIRGLVRNLGGDPIPGGRILVREGDAELAAVELPPVGGGDLAPASVQVTLPPGVHELEVMAEVAGDERPANSVVPILVRCGGDTEPPTLEVTAPADGATLPAGTIALTGTALDDVGLGSLEYSLDGGLWQPMALADSWEGSVTLGAGEHRLRIRCTDTSENHTQLLLTLTAK